MPSDLNTIILKSIKSSSKYGLEIIDDIKKATNGTVILKQPSLYSALRRLEAKGYVSSFWRDSELGGKRHYYQATKQGIDALNSNIKIQDATDEFLNPQTPPTSQSEVNAYNMQNNSSSTAQKILDEDEFDEDEPESDKAPINYKSILGDFLNDDDDFIKEEPKPTTPSHVEIKEQKKEETKATQTSSYLKELEQMFKSDKPAQKPQQQKTEQRMQQQNETLKSMNKAEEMRMLEEMAKKYNKEISREPENAQTVEMNLLQKINEKKKIDEMQIKRHESQYLLINDMNFASGLCIFFISMAVYLTLFLLYLLKGWVDLEKYIIMGVCFLCSIIIVIYDLSCYRTQPDKRISIKFNWFKSFIVRFITFALLLVFIVSVNLLIGMESLTALFEVKYFIRWSFPTVLICGILFRWLINFILSKQRKYQTSKQDKKEEA